MVRLVVAALLAVTGSALVTPLAAVAASAPNLKVDTDPTQRELELYARLREKLLRDAAIADPVAAKGKSRSVQVHRFVPVCTGLPGSVNANASCVRAAAQCQRSGLSNATMMWEYVGPEGITRPTPGQWTIIGRTCREIRDPVESRPDVVLTLRDFQRLPLPAGGMHLQPDSRQFLVNMPTNLYVSAQPLTLTTTVLGVRVEVVATPIRFLWTFGDGGTLATTDHGAPYPDMTTTHTYRRTGTYPVTLTTVYSGRYRVAGDPGGWIPVTGTAQVASPATTVQVNEARAVLVN